jgi:hypothetical protein
MCAALFNVLRATKTKTKGAGVRLERISIEGQEKKKSIKRWRAQRMIAKGAES